MRVCTRGNLTLFGRVDSGYQQSLHFEYRIVPCAGRSTCDEATRLCPVDVGSNERCPSNYHVCPDGTRVPYSYPDCTVPTCPPACESHKLCEQVRRHLSWFRSQILTARAQLQCLQVAGHCDFCYEANVEATCRRAVSGQRECASANSVLVASEAKCPPKADYYEQTHIDCSQFETCDECHAHPVCTFCHTPSKRLSKTATVDEGRCVQGFNASCSALGLESRQCGPPLPFCSTETIECGDSAMTVVRRDPENNCEFERCPADTASIVVTVLLIVLLVCCCVVAGGYVAVQYMRARGTRINFNRKFGM